MSQALKRPPTHTICPCFQGFPPTEHLSSQYGVPAWIIPHCLHCSASHSSHRWRVTKLGWAKIPLLWNLWVILTNIYLCDDFGSACANSPGSKHINDSAQFLTRRATGVNNSRRNLHLHLLSKTTTQVTPFNHIAHIRKTAWKSVIP